MKERRNKSDSNCFRIVMCLIAIFLFYQCNPAYAVNYYVATTGSDANTGTLSTPWRTLQHAADVMVSGDTVFVQPGTYAGFMSARPGTLANPIIFKAIGSGVILNSRNPNTVDIINIENWSGPAHDYIVVDGFEITGSTRSGVRVIGARGVVIENNNIHHNGYWGILTGWAPEVQILNNSTHDQNGGSAQHGIYVSNSNSSPDNPIIRGNTVYGNTQNGIQVNGDCGTLPTDGWIDGGNIEGNVVYGNGWKGLSIISMRNATIQNNVIYGNGLTAGAGGIHLAYESAASCSAYPSNGNTIVNNTVYEPRIAAIRISGGTNNVLFNNILISTNPYVNETGAQYHDTTSNIERTSTTGLFVNAGASDYHLSSSSSAINVGIQTYQSKNAPITDKDGVARPSGSAYDSGAYEYATIAAKVPRAPTNLQIFP